MVEKNEILVMDKSWEEIYSLESAHEKAEFFKNILFQKLEEIFPEKVLKISSDDQPWISFKLKKLDRKRKRVFRKERRSEKWKKLDKLFKKTTTALNLSKVVESPGLFFSLTIAVDKKEMTFHNSFFDFLNWTDYVHLYLLKISSFAE